MRYTHTKIYQNMNVLFLIYLCIIGSFFWSFASVLIYRLKEKQKWSRTGRSKCRICHTQLRATDLIPIISWLIYRWKCKYCKKWISIIYPLLELSMAGVFLWVWYFLIDPSLLYEWNIWEILKLIFWLTIIFFTVLYSFYDILFLEIHEWIMLWAILFTFTFILLQTLFPAWDIIPPLMTSNTDILWTPVLSFLTFILSIAILSWLYAIMLLGMKEIYDIAIIITSIIFLTLFSYFFQIPFSQTPVLSATLWALWIFTFLFIQILISQGKRMWWGDLRIAILIGLILWIQFSAIWVFLCYCIGSILSLGYISIEKIQKMMENTNQ